MSASSKAEPAPLIIFAMSEKGLAVLRALIDAGLGGHVATVVAEKDAAVERDYHEEIVATARAAGIGTLHRGEPLPAHRFAIAVGWRFMIHGEDSLVVFHDSLLPRYRGFAPLVNSLINGENEVGVSALWATEAYDRGPIIEQASVAVAYPLRIQEAIDAVIPLYEALALRVVSALVSGERPTGVAQDESRSTYSIWRDEEDYRIDWSEDASRLARFVDAVGVPYQGALTRTADRELRVWGAEALAEDIAFELRHPGKVFAISEGCPEVVCGAGLLRLTAITDAQTGESVLPWTRLRTRFLNGTTP